MKFIKSIPPIGLDPALYNEYLEDLLKNNEHRVEKLGKVFHNSDVPDDIETRMVLITKG